MLYHAFLKRNITLFHKVLCSLSFTIKRYNDSMVMMYNINNASNNSVRIVIDMIMLLNLLVGDFEGFGVYFVV